MIDFSRTMLTHFALHQVGNKGLGEELVVNNFLTEFTDDFVKETVLRYFLTPFKTDVYYQFRGKVDITLQSVQNLCEMLFNGRDDNSFIENSQGFAKHLYDQGMHPKIKGGTFYVCYFKDVVCDGELVDAIGIFKTENQHTYLKLQPDGLNLEADCGIDIKKLDKGCLIFNTEKETGYKISIIDTNNKPAECALYWQEDFLNSVIKQNSYYHTKNILDVAVGFCEEILTEQNNVKKEDQMMMLNTSTSYFKGKDKFNLREFEKEVLKEPEVISAFQDYRSDFNKKLDLTAIEEFDISTTAVKKNEKYMRSVVKLDKNFHIYIHARHDYVERGYDEDKGLKYYKLFYVNEEN